MKMKTYLATLLFICGILAVPHTAATHDPNDFFALEAAFPGVEWAAIYGISPTVLFAVGTNSASASVIASRSGGTWSLPTVPDIGPLGDVWVASATQAYATPSQFSNNLAAPNYQFLVWNGVSWAIDTIDVVSPGTRVAPTHVHGISATNILFGGLLYNTITTPNTYEGQSALLTFDGSTFASQTPCAFRDIQYVFGFGGTVYNTGSDNLNFGATARSNTPGCGGTRNTIFRTQEAWRPSSTAADTIVVGDAGLVQRDDLVSAPVQTPTDSNLRGIDGVSAADGWIVGDAGVILHSATPLVGGWTLEPSTTIQNFVAVRFTSAVDGWAVTDEGGIFRLQVNAPVALPSLAGLELERDNFNIVAEDSCLGDEATFRINTDQTIGAGGITAYVIDSDTNTVIQTWVVTAGAPWYNLNDRLFHASFAYPAGDYQFLATADIMSVLEPDLFSAWPFNVNTGSCYTAGDALNIQNRFDSIDADLTDLGVAVEIINRTTIQIDRNESNDFVYSNALQNSSHAHIDTHFVYTNDLINNTAITLIGNISVNNTSVEALIHEADSQIGLSIYAIMWLAVMVVLVIWAEYSKNLYIYVLAILAGMTFTIILWDAIAGLQILTIGTTAMVAFRAFEVYRNSDDTED